MQVNVGDALVDECGICDGSGIADVACDCDGNTLDCAGERGGDAIIDECGICIEVSQRKILIVMETVF